MKNKEMRGKIKKEQEMMMLMLTKGKDIQMSLLQNIAPISYGYPAHTHY